MTDDITDNTYTDEEESDDTPDDGTPASSPADKKKPNVSEGIVSNVICHTQAHGAKTSTPNAGPSDDANGGSVSQGEGVGQGDAWEGGVK